MRCLPLNREKLCHLPHYRLNSSFHSQIDDDNLSKLEKADILELTVNHLTKLHKPNDPVIEAKKFQAGFGQCAAEAARFIMSVPDLDENVSQNLVGHLSRLITTQPLTVQLPEKSNYSPPHSPSSVVSDRHHYYSDQDRSSSDAEDSGYMGEGPSRHYPRQPEPRPQPRKQSPPLAGLLTTVDKVAFQNYVPREKVNYPSDVPRSAAYFNRVPAEAKDAILKKIRQHIMDKRGNDVNGMEEVNAVEDLSGDNKYLLREEEYRNELPYPYSALNFANANQSSLDLRKVRSPPKQPLKRPMECPTVPEPLSLVENKFESVSNAPADPSDLTMDYNNLPPKKKRKMLEYQAYKKQEEAKRQLEASFEIKRERFEGPPAAPDHYLDASKWRPW